MELLKEVNDLLAEAEEPYEETEEQLAPYFDAISSSSFSSVLLIGTLDFKEFKRVSYDFRKIIREALNPEIYDMGFSYLHPKNKRKMRKLIFSLIFDIPITSKDYKKLFKNKSKIVLPVSDRLRLLTEGEDISSYTFLSKKEEERILFPVRLLAYYYICLYFHFFNEENIVFKKTKCLLSLMEEELFHLGRKEFFELSTDSYINTLTDNTHTQEALKKEIYLCYKRNRNDWDPFIHSPYETVKHHHRDYRREISLSLDGFSNFDKGEPFFYFSRTCLLEQKEIDTYKETLLLKCQQRLNLIKKRPLRKKDQFHLKELKQRIENIYNWKAIE